MVFLTQPVAEVAYPTFRPQIGLRSTAKIITGPVIRRTMLPIPLFLNLLDIGRQAPQHLNGRHHSHTITLRARTLQLPQTLPARATRQNPFISTLRISTFPLFHLHSTQRKVGTVPQRQLQEIVLNLVRQADTKQFLLEVKPVPRTPSPDPRNTSEINVEALSLHQTIIIDISAVIAMTPATHHHPQSTSQRSRLQSPVSQLITATPTTPTSPPSHQSLASSATTSTRTATVPPPPPNHPAPSPCIPKSASSPHQAETHLASGAVTVAGERHYSKDEPSARTAGAGATTAEAARVWTAPDA
jgi:hypothetical protein